MTEESGKDEPQPAAAPTGAEPAAVDPAMVDPAMAELTGAAGSAELGAAVQQAGPEPEPEPQPEPDPEPVSEAGPAVASVAGSEQPERAEHPERAGQVEAPDSSDGPAAPLDGRGRLRNAVWPPRVSRGQLVVALLLFALGLGLAIQVRSTNDHSALRGARQDDLVRILDELDSRQQRLQQEKNQLDQSLTQLENSSNQAKEAQEQTQQKTQELGVLAGTVKASGPGIVLTVDDPQGQVKADMLLDTLQELRAAGAEAIQINDVRVVAHTYFTDLSSGGVSIDGTKVAQPYRFTVIGDPQDLTPALNIPGGIVRTLEKEQVGTNISEQQRVTVDALAVPAPAQFAKPAAQ
ncbi:DUF881 domain-containing protein [Kitasatospora sp. NBC_01287]|uniref:DUF881 domain-containing protein n=1 Tax=Kitasatospora sp. NBC_01287 TaxID=2903573 RepID=UPI002250C073|nr:DUF881 domain-containing protein [Kitasatospora sp. NBC_01287]MCX4750769.1 DUF881 domain-containing protein [Kitasatospora sp. NBC_01287]